MHGFYLANGFWFCYGTLAFTTTSNRAADSGIFRVLSANGKPLLIVEPYAFPCRLNNENYLRLSGRTADTIYFAPPMTWNANTEFRTSFNFVGKETN